MENVCRERCEDGGSRLGVSTIQKQMPCSHLFISQSPSSPFRRITDETLPYVSGIFDDTIEPSLNSELPDHSQFKTLAKNQAELISGLKSQNKASYNSWLSPPMETCHSIDFSMSITSPPDDIFTDVTKTNPVEGTPDICTRLPEPGGCLENAGFDSTKDFQEKSDLNKNTKLNATKDLNENTGLNATKDLNENPGLNATKDLHENPGLNATKDLNENPGLNATKDLNENPGLNATKDLNENPGLNATKDLNENPGLNATKDLNENPGLNATKDLNENTELNATKDLNENPELNATKDLNENPELNSTKDFNENSGLSSSKDLNENPGLNSTKDLTENHVLNATKDLNENPGLNATEDLHENPGINATKDLNENPRLNATKDLNEDPALNATKDVNENLGLNATKDLSEKSGLNSSVSDTCEGAKSNTTFEKSLEQGEISAPKSSSSVSTVDGTLEVVKKKPLNSAVDVCETANTSPEQPSEKLDCRIDIAQTVVPKKLQCSEGLCSGEDCKVHGTFTKPIEKQYVVQQYAGVSLHVSPKAGMPRSANLQPVDGTSVKHDVTTDVTLADPSLKNATSNLIKPSDTAELQTPSGDDANVDGGVPIDHTPSPEPSEHLRDSMVPDKVVSRTLDLPEAAVEDEPQEPRKRKNGVFEQDSCLSLDISHCSIFSLDDLLERTSRDLVTSTPIVLGRGFDRLRCAKPIEMQKRLSVINSIEAHSNNDLAGVSGSDAAGADPSSVKSETCSEAPQNSAKSTTSSSSTSGAAHNPTKMVLRRKIPQPGSFACKSSIPKTQIHAKPPISQGASSMVGKAKAVPAAPAPSQPETSASVLHGVKRTVLLNKGKKPTTTAKMIKTSYVTGSTSGCTMATGTKPSQMKPQAKPSELPPPGRGRLGLKPPGIAVFSAEAGHPQTSNKPTGLPGMRTRSSLLPAFAQKHASSEALPLAKRKRNDVQDQHSSAEPPTSSKPNEAAQSRVPKNMKPKVASHDCNTCTILKDKLNTFHQEIGGFLQELVKRPAGCNWTADWLPFQSKFETYLEELKRLQAEHQ